MAISRRTAFSIFTEAAVSPAAISLSPFFPALAQAVLQTINASRQRSCWQNSTHAVIGSLDELALSVAEDREFFEDFFGMQ